LGFQSTESQGPIAAVKIKNFYFVASSTLPAFLRRDSTSQEADIHVGTPKRGNTQRMSKI
jgi:hypothetical protein